MWAHLTINLGYSGRQFRVSLKLIIVKGFITYRATLIEYKDIVLVGVKDEILGKIFGYGDVLINVYGAKQYTFDKIPHFLKVKNIIEERKIKAERR